jgi:hypothetical protein
MPTTTRTILPVASHTDLTVTSPSIDVPANLLGITLRMVSTEFTDPSLTCALQLDQSFDGGATWRNVEGQEAVGGFVARNGPDFGKPLQPAFHVDFSQEQRDAALVRARWTSQGTWVYGLVLDQET